MLFSFIVGKFQSVFFGSVFQDSLLVLFVIVLFRAMSTSLLRSLFWSFLFFSLARIKQCLPPSLDKTSPHHRDFLPYSWAILSHAIFSFVFTDQAGWARCIVICITEPPPPLKRLTKQKNPNPFKLYKTRSAIQRICLQDPTTRDSNENVKKTNKQTIGLVGKTRTSHVRHTFFVKLFFSVLARREIP